MLQLLVQIRGVGSVEQENTERLFIYVSLPPVSDQNVTDVLAFSPSSPSHVFQRPLFPDLPMLPDVMDNTPFCFPTQPHPGPNWFRRPQQASGGSGSSYNSICAAARTNLTILTPVEGMLTRSPAASIWWRQAWIALRWSQIGEESGRWETCPREEGRKIRSV
jgi:hypothetical protein